VYKSDKKTIFSSKILKKILKKGSLEGLLDLQKAKKKLLEKFSKSL